MADFLEWARPFLKGITEKLDVSVQNKVLAPNEKVEFRPHKEGYLIDISGVTDTPYVNITQNFLGQKVSYSTFSIKTYSGVTAPNPSVQFVPVYDTTNSIYTISYTPRPYKYYNKSMLIEIIAPSVNPITGLPIVTNMTIIAMTVHYIDIDDLPLLKESIKELLKLT